MLTILSKMQVWVGLHDQTGASLIEYALLVLLIAIVTIVAVTFAGEQVSEAYSQMGSGLANP